MSGPAWLWGPSQPPEGSRTCKVCGLPYSAHSGRRCRVCGDAFEHHDRPRKNGSEPLRSVVCVAGQARMAKARLDAGIELNDLDRLVLALPRNP